MKYTHLFPMDPWNHEITYSHGAWNLQLLMKQRVCSWHLLVRCCLSTALYWGVSSLFFTLSWGNQTSIEWEVSGSQLSSPWSMSDFTNKAPPEILGMRLQSHLLPELPLLWICFSLFCAVLSLSFVLQNSFQSPLSICVFNTVCYNLI